MITRARFQNFKALRDVEIAFDSRLTVLVGPNGSGKTSVLEGIRFVGNYFALNQGPSMFPVAIDTPVGKGSRLVFGWQHDPSTTFDKEVFDKSLIEVIDHEADDTEVFCRYTGSVSAHGQFLVTPEKGTISSLPALSHLHSMMHLQLNARELRQPSFPQQIPPYTAPNGSGLASTLSYLQKKYPDRFLAVIDSLREVIPNSVGIRLDLEECRTRVPTGEKYEQSQFADVFLLDFRDAEGVSPASVSDGTLFVLGLLSIIFGPAQPKLILLDDLDHRLHPKAQMELVELLRKLLDQFPDLQIIATAHSPYILDRLEWNEVRVTTLNEDGSSVCKPITDHPDFERWKDAMSPGEFWSTFYEDWLTKAREPQTVP